MTASEIKAGENDLGLKGSPTQVKNIFAPEAKKDRKMLEGSADEIIATLVKELGERKCI
jgi:electron transfer flavoprotein beta subunit